jgi:CRISPR/Cas system-associated protein endoribonuclease Cas2
MSFWLKFVRDSNLSVNNSTILKYSMALADRFSTIEELLANDENELTKLGITNQADRIRLMKQARLLDDKVNDETNLLIFLINFL